MHFRTLLFALLFALPVAFSTSAQAQAPVYEAFAVDSVAAPSGGPAMLETFLAVNVQKPFMARVANATGRVFVKAIVEPDGHLSEVTLIRGFRPDCDAEALRAMRLFNAWKPALKDGKPVRQAITYPVIFRANELVVYSNGQQIDYIDKDSKPTADKQLATKQMAVSTDSVTGLPTGDLVMSAIQASGKLRELVRLPLIRTETKPDSPGGGITHTLGHRQGDTKWFGYSYTFNERGTVTNRNHNPTNERVEYADNGMVRSAVKLRGEATSFAWHGNGQLQQTEVYDGTLAKTDINPNRLMMAWDSTGQQTVRDGNGQATFYKWVNSRADSKRQVCFVETGSFSNGHKNGIWTGTYSDESYKYEETFDHGKCTGGTALVNGTIQLTYLGNEQKPEFKGGISRMYEFISRTIRYPRDAARAGIQGKVFFSFVVCTDGSLCDYEVVQPLDPWLDAEALRVIKSMNGQWKPGYQRGEPVRVEFRMPVAFQLE